MKVQFGVVIGGKYIIERPVGRGGMGSVWAARHVTLGCIVAVKVVDTNLLAVPHILARFEREACAAANLDTPHVARVHDHGVEGDTPYLVMEMLRGQDLAACLKERGRLPLSVASDILVQMGRGLRCAHDAGIVHRDLKPQNVFLSRTETGEEIVKILDFGIAKATAPRTANFTKPGEMLGSPRYMSPEQARGEATIDHRTDLWATGVLLYRMVTGRLPFSGDDILSILSAVQTEPFVPVVQVAPALPPALDGFFARALAKDREQRFASIADLVESFTDITGYVPPRTTGTDMAALTQPLMTAGHKGPLPFVAAPPAMPSMPPASGHQSGPPAAVSVAQKGASASRAPMTNMVTHVLPRPASPPKRRARWVWVVLGALVCVAALSPIWLVGTSPAEPSPAAKAPPAAQPGPTAAASALAPKPAVSDPAPPPAASSAMKLAVATGPTAVDKEPPKSPPGAGAAPAPRLKKPRPKLSSDDPWGIPK